MAQAPLHRREALRPLSDRMSSRGFCYLLSAHHPGPDPRHRQPHLDSPQLPRLKGSNSELTKFLLKSAPPMLGRPGLLKAESQVSPRHLAGCCPPSETEPAGTTASARHPSLGPVHSPDPSPPHRGRPHPSTPHLSPQHRPPFNKCLNAHRGPGTVPPAGVQD